MAVLILPIIGRQSPALAALGKLVRRRTDFIPQAVIFPLGPHFGTIQISTKRNIAENQHSFFLRSRFGFTQLQVQNPLYIRKEIDIFAIFGFKSIYRTRLKIFKAVGPSGPRLPFVKFLYRAKQCIPTQPAGLCGLICFKGLKTRGINGGFCL